LWFGIKNKDINSAEGSQNSLEFEIIIISQNQNVFSCFRDASYPCYGKVKPKFKLQGTNPICSIVIKPIMLQIIKNQFNYQQIPMGNARTDQNWKRKVKKNITQSIILVHPSSRATSSLLCPSSKESSTKSINCSITINHTIPTPCKNQETHWIEQLLPTVPQSIQQTHKAKSYSLKQYNHSSVL